MEVVVAGQFVRNMAPGQSPSSLPQQERPVRMGAAGIASPKRAVSLSRDGASVSLLAKGEREPVVSGPKQGAKPTEVYGFVGAISTLVAFVVFIIWAYLPESWLHAVGITYYPSRYWAMAIPSYLMVAIFFICTFYTSLNYIATPPPHSLNTLFDEHTRQPMKVLCTSGSLGKEDQPIDSLSDIPITTVNALLFDHKLG